MAKKFRIDIDSVENYVSNHVRLFIGAVLIVVFLAVLAAVTVFFVNVRGEEQTMVPDIVGRELAEALVELQAKELYPRIQLRFTETAGDKGMILEQDPSPGTIVKAGRRIRLVVSRGVIIDRIADYVGRDIDDVRLEIAALKSENQTSFLSIKEPATYKVSTEKPGTILEQSPLYGTGISGPVTLSFVVSRGEENETINIPDFTGLSLKEALSQLNTLKTGFVFNSRQPAGNEKADTIVSQDPQPQENAASNTVIYLTVAEPKLEKGEIYGIFQHKLVENPYPLPVKLEALFPTGELRVLAEVDHPGGDFSVPYKVQEGSTLILSVVNREVFRQVLKTPIQTSPPFEQL